MQMKSYTTNVHRAVTVRQRFVLCILTTIALLGSTAEAGEAYSEFPPNVDPDGVYVIYSHGRIVEGNNSKPVHERWGVYDFPAIKRALAKNDSFNLIARHRPENADLAGEAEQLVSWVRRLLDGGVQPENITLVGFSRGGEITAVASSQLNPLAVNTVLLATCWRGGVQERASITFSGRFLSIFETTDLAQTCERIAARSDGLVSFDEIEISTGKEHGAFYTPLQEWTGPLLRWIDQNSAENQAHILSIPGAARSIDSMRARYFSTSEIAVS